MPYVPTRRGRERILVMGDQGTGKSATVLSIVLGCPQSWVDVIDTDYNWEVMADGAPENLRIHEIDDDDFPGLLAKIREASKGATRDDWLVLDSITPSFLACQEHYVKITFGMSYEAFAQKARKEMDDEKKVLQLFEGFKDWNVINPMYFELYKLLMKYPGHVLCIAEAKDLGSQDEKDSELMHVFGRIGRKPAGQKGMPYKFHTIIYMIQKGREKYAFSNIKDRESLEYTREKVSAQEMTKYGFVKDYLVAIAGWKFEKPKRVVQDEDAGE